MLLSYQAFFGVLFGVVLSFFFVNFAEIFSSIAVNKKPIVLAVGILSARENFHQRSVARSTWLNYYHSRISENVKSWFVIGNSSCSIPPDYRLSYHDCEKWNINVSNIEREIFTLQEIDFGNCSPGSTAIIHQGFTFKVNHPLIVNKLGILSNAIVPNKLSKVAIMDVHSKEIVVEATIFNNASDSYHGYLYAPISNILLPKHYEGLVLFEGFLQHSLCSSLVWDDGGGVITFKRIYTSSYHQDSKKYSENIYSAVSMGFLINERDNLRKISDDEATETEKWHLHLKNVEKKIEFEESQYKDLLIVDAVDFYRNLPNKVLHFYKWLHTNLSYLYVLKTDDDTVINLEALLEELQNNSKYDPKHLWLWSRFRKNWPVNYVGKWADNDYRSDYYPAFPCGAAYIASYQTSAWLSDNAAFLFPYQGEDVSLGIWLSAINPDYIEDEHFECDSSCNQNSYNRAQLESDEIQEIWLTFRTCKNLCKCNSS